MHEMMHQWTDPASLISCFTSLSLVNPPLYHSFFSFFFLTSTSSFLFPLPLPLSISFSLISAGLASCDINTLATGMIDSLNHSPPPPFPHHCNKHLHMYPSATVLSVARVCKCFVLVYMYLRSHWSVLITNSHWKPWIHIKCTYTLKPSTQWTTRNQCVYFRSCLVYLWPCVSPSRHHTV